MVRQEHGGNADQVAGSFGFHPQDMLDLSTGISPIPYPAQAIEMVSCRALPTQTQLRRCLEAARSSYQIPKSLAVMAGAGTQSLLQAIPALCRPNGEVWISMPNYNEHAPAWLRAGHKVTHDQTFPASAKHAVLVMPNNPTGEYDEAMVEMVAESVNKRGGITVVDGAFARPDEAALLARLVHLKNVIHLRSFGKFFGLAGLRLGFAIGHPNFIEKLETMAGPWAVSNVALDIGACALADSKWQRQHAAFLDSQSARLAKLLRNHDLRILGGTNLFQTATSIAAHDLHTHLAFHGIWVRKYKFWPELLRFGVPGSCVDLARLDQTLRKWRSKSNQ